MNTKVNKLEPNQSPGVNSMHRLLNQAAAAAAGTAFENGPSSTSAMASPESSVNAVARTATTGSARTGASKTASSASSTSAGAFMRKGQQQQQQQQSPRPWSPCSTVITTSTPQEKDVLSKLPKMERLPNALFRWNTNEEIAAWLFSAQQHPHWFTLDVRLRPPNGSMLLYHKKGSNYKHDGYVWKKRKDGKLPREDHMRLKVKGVEIIYANYVHSALVPTFHRRSYWLLSYPDVVLVHYLNTPGEGELIERIVPSLRLSIAQFTRAELLEQLKPMLCTGPLTFDDQNHSASTSGDGFSSQNDAASEERLRFVNNLIDQARQNKAAPAPQAELQQLGAGTSGGQTTKPGQALVLTSVGGQLLLAIDAQSPAGTALLAAQHRQQGIASFQASTKTAADASSGHQESLSSSPPSSGSPPTAQQQHCTGTFVAPAAMGAQQQQQQQQIVSRVLNGIRSNSCSSASRRVMCSTIMRRQPSAFSDGADDVFRPLSEAVTAASSSCSMADVGGQQLMGGVHAGQQHGASAGTSDSAYCSFAKDDEGHGFERPRRSARDEGALAAADIEMVLPSAGSPVVDLEKFLQQQAAQDEDAKCGQTRASGDPMLSAGEQLDDSANLGLSQEDIATTLRANLAAMIDKPSTELFRALSPPRVTHHTQSMMMARPTAMPSTDRSGTVLDRRAMMTNNGEDRDAASPMDESCSTYIPSTHLLTSPDSSFRLLNHILSGEDYGDEEGGGAVDECSMKSTSANARMEEEDEANHQRKQSDTSSCLRGYTSSADNYFPDESSLHAQSNISTLAMSGGGGQQQQSNNIAVDLGSMGSRAASCSSSQGSAGSTTGMVRFTESRLANTGYEEFAAMSSAAGSSSGGVQTIQDEHRQRQGHNAVATITDYSPDWSYIQGGTKILISGPWYSTSHRYNCLFGEVSAPACLIQTGVLRCYCPPHDAGTVSLIVCCDEQAISNAVHFEYRPNQSSESMSNGAGDGQRWSDVAPEFWIGANESHFCMGLLERLEAMEKSLVTTSLDSKDAIEAQPMDREMKEGTAPPRAMVSLQDLELRLIRVCRKMAQKDWKPFGPSNQITSPSSSFAHHCGMTILHFAAALGFARLIVVLYQWFREQRNPRLEAELHFTKQDHNGRTALMWACIRGKTEAANLLARGCRDSLFISDRVRLGELPLAVAFRDGHVELVREVVQQFVSENGGDPDARDLDTALWVLTSGLVERSQLIYYNTKRPYIHARRHQCSQHQPLPPSQLPPPSTADHADNDHRRQSFLNGITPTISTAHLNTRLRKQLSLDSQMIKPPLTIASAAATAAANQFGRGKPTAIQTAVRRDGKTGGRECAKRTSVEGLEELMKHATNEPVESTGVSRGGCRHYSESAGINHRSSTTSDVGLTLSSKITRQDSENSSSVTSYMSVEEWLKQPLSVEIPMDITVPDSPTASDMWETVAGSVSEPSDNDGVRAQIASLAQQIIDALPDRIKQETFLEEEYEGADQLQQQQQQTYCDSTYFGDGSEMITGSQHTPQQTLPQVMVGGAPSDNGGFMAYRHYDAPTPCSSSLSPGSARSPSFVIPSMCGTADAIMTQTVVRPSADQSYNSIPISPNNFLQVSPCSTGGMQSRDIFLFPSPNCASSFAHYGSLQQQEQQQLSSCSAGGRCCQQQQQQQQQAPAINASDATNLGEFFNAARSRSPLECHFQDLTLTDREQRQLYEAAKVIQNAYRQYRQRVQTQTYSDMERQAAVVIQTCFRRYRQYCYFKKLHQAAVLIQKHFRLYKAAKRSKTNPDGTTTSTPGGLTIVRRPSAASADAPKSGTEEENLSGFTQFLENAVQQAIGNKDTTVLMTAQSTTPGSSNPSKPASIRIQVTPEELMRWKQHLAAMRIQHAFRGHRKRQDAAARKIQKFMREARQNCSNDLDFMIAESKNRYHVGGSSTNCYRNCQQQRRQHRRRLSGGTSATTAPASVASTVVTAAPAALMTTGAGDSGPRGDFSAWLSMYASQQHQKLNVFSAQNPLFNNS